MKEIFLTIFCQIGPKPGNKYYFSFAVHTIICVVAMTEVLFSWSLKE